MDKIVFRMHPTQRDFKKSNFSKLMTFEGFRIYLIVMSVVLILCVFWIYYGTEVYTHFAHLVLFFVFFGLIIPFVVSYSMSIWSFRYAYPRVEECICEVGEKGIGWKSDPLSVFLSWKQVSTIYETKDFIFVRLKKGHIFPVFKNCILDASVEDIRKILLNAPVENKKMITK